MIQNETWMDISSGIPQPSAGDTAAGWETEKNPSPEPAGYTEHAAPGPQPLQKPQRVRRVGSFTMGVALIACGVLVLLFLLFHNMEMLFTAAKWSPVLLILLGVEVLVSNFLFRKDKLKYDFLSGFFCLCVIGSSLLLSAGSVVYEYGEGRYEAEASISQQISDQCYEQLQGTQEISSLSVHVSLNGGSRDLPQTYQNLRAYDDVHIDVRLVGQDADAQAFAQRCKAISDRLDTGNLSLVSVSFYAGNLDNGQAEYDLTIHDRFQKELSAEQLAELVDVTQPEPDGEGTV